MISVICFSPKTVALRIACMVLQIDNLHIIWQLELFVVIDNYLLILFNLKFLTYPFLKVMKIIMCYCKVDWLSISMQLSIWRCKFIKFSIIAMQV